MVLVKMNGLKTECRGFGVAVMRCMLGMLESGDVRMETILAVVLLPWFTPADSSLRHFMACTTSIAPGVHD